MMDSRELSGRVADRIGGIGEYVAVESLHQVVRVTVEILAEEGFVALDFLCESCGEMHTSMYGRSTCPDEVIPV
jgi:hypothetical protein